jgi:hypothetical protein
MLSAIYGSFKKIPETILCLAENDIMLPDQQLSIQKLSKVNI